MRLVRSSSGPFVGLHPTYFLSLTSSLYAKKMGPFAGMTAPFLSQKQPKCQGRAMGPLLYRKLLGGTVSK